MLPMCRTTCLVAVILLLQGGIAGSQELEPRFYTNLPLDLNFLAVGYARSSGGVLLDPSIALENADLTIEGPFVGYARSLGIGGLSGKVNVGVAYVCLSGSADFEGARLTRETCGWSDAKLRLTVNFFGAPALSPKEFAGYRQDLVAGASLLLSVPSGEYDGDRLVNIGANRFAAKAELGISKAAGRWFLEAALGATFYERNDDFFGGRVREQDPILSLQAHIVRRFESGIWAALDYTRYRGGDTQTGGLPNDNLQSNARAGMTLSMPVDSRHSLKFHASTGVATRTGSDFDSIGITWQYRWQ